MGLIDNRRVRAGTFGKRKEGLKKKADELSVLCGVDVALLVAAADGNAGGADVWESKEGVLARYRALGAEVRAKPTQRACLEGELGKGEAKLARVRQGGPDGLARWDKALDGVATAEEAQRLLDAVVAAIWATDETRRKLGMPVDDDGKDGSAGILLEGIAPLNFAAGDEYQMQQVQPNLPIMWSADESRHAMVPLADTAVAPGVQGIGGRSFAIGASGNFVNSLPALSLAMGTGGGNFINAPPAAPSYTMSGSGDNMFCMP